MTCRNALTALALVACSGGHHHTVDAPPLDAATDTLSPSSGDPPPNAVALYVTDRGLPAANISVFFQTPDSTLELGAVTDRNGIAWALAGAGDFVTAIEPNDGQGTPTLSTFAGVKPGDRLHLDLHPTDPVPESTLMLHVPTRAGATGYQIRYPCGDPVTVDATAASEVTLLDCGGGMADLVVLPLDVDGGMTLGALFSTGVPIAEGTQTATVSGSYAALDATSFAYSNIPANVAAVSTYEAIVTAHGRVFEATAEFATPSGGTAQTTISVPHTPGGTLALTVTQETPTATELGQQAVFVLQPWSASYAGDLTAVRLPEYSAVATYDAPSSSLAWSERGGAMLPSLVRARANIIRTGIPSGKTWTWRIVGPRVGAFITLPKLPIDGYDYNPSSTDTVSVVELTNALVPGGYDTVRERGFGELGRVMAPGTMITEDAYSPPL